MGKLFDMILLKLACEEECLPVGVGLGDGLHGKQVMVMVFEDERCNCAGRSKLSEPAEAEGFSMDTLRTAEPVYLDAELFERLLENPGFAIGAFDVDGAVGDATGEGADDGLLVCANASGGAEVDEKGIGLFDVEHGDLSGDEKHGFILREDWGGAKGAGCGLPLLTAAGSRVIATAMLLCVAAAAATSKGSGARYEGCVKTGEGRHMIFS